MQGWLFRLLQQFTNSCIYCQCHSLLKNAGFLVTKWTSNSIGILNTLPKDDIWPKIINLNLANLPIERTVGIVWDRKSDQITIQSLSKEFENSKWGLLSYISHIFNSLVTVNLVLLEVKLLCQELWQRKLEWGDKISINLLECWIIWKSSLGKYPYDGFIQTMNLNLQLQVFCDGSCKPYGFVCYCRSEDKRSKKWSFICGKLRLAPINKNTLTIPSLELH